MAKMPAKLISALLLVCLISLVSSKKIWDEIEDKWKEVKDDVKEDWEELKDDIEDNWDDVEDDWDDFVGDWKKAFKDIFHKDIDKIKNPFEDWRRKRSISEKIDENM